MLTADLRRRAIEVLAHLPCSLEMPAGTGKTQLVAAMAATTTQLGYRTLVLTHTHAGVDAIRRGAAAGPERCMRPRRQVANFNEMSVIPAVGPSAQRSRRRRRCCHWNG